MEADRKDENTSKELFAREERSDFGYMDDLVKAYGEKLAEKRKETELSEEKRSCVLSSQRKIKEIGSELLLRVEGAEQKELLYYAIESADRCAAMLEREQAENEKTRDLSHYPVSVLLARAVLLANRGLNVLLGGNSANRKEFDLILSELSAFYAIAAIR